MTDPTPTPGTLEPSSLPNRMRRQVDATEHYLVQNGLDRHFAQTLLSHYLDFAREIEENTRAQPTPPEAGEGWVSACCEGERCFCGALATNKVAEVVQHDDPLPHRHELTSYVCSVHFRQIMGPAAPPAPSGGEEKLKTIGDLYDFMKAAYGKVTVGMKTREVFVAGFTAGLDANNHIATPPRAPQPGVTVESIQALIDENMRYDDRDPDASWAKKTYYTAHQILALIQGNPHG